VVVLPLGLPDGFFSVNGLWVRHVLNRLCVSLLVEVYGLVFVDARIDELMTLVREKHFLSGRLHILADSLMGR